MPDAVHRAARRFGDVADAYERTRPSYPPEAIAWLAAELGLGPGARVVDVGAGTGKLTRLLAATGADVWAVEPVEGMRARLAAAAPGVELVDGTAESLPFPDGWVDAVTAAQAAHWFGDGAPAELARVVRPGGAVAVVYNRRDRSQRVQAVISAVREREAAGAPSTASGEWRRRFEACAALELAGASTFAWSLDLDHPGVLDQARSLAPIAALDERRRAAVLAEIDAALVGEPDVVTLRYTTEITLWRRA